MLEEREGKENCLACLQSHDKITSVIILGVDPGIAITGWGTVKLTAGNCINPKYDCIKTSPRNSPEARLNSLYQQITKIIKTQKPKEAAIEKLFFNTNAKTVMMVGQARGVVLLALSQQNIPVFHYTPTEIKLATTGYGRANKTQIQRMVKSLLGLTRKPKPDDVSDALAAAITHAYTNKF